MIKYYFFLTLSFLSVSTLHAQNRYDFLETENPADEHARAIEQRDSLKKNPIELGYAILPSSINQTQISFLSSADNELINESINPRSLIIHSLYIGLHLHQWESNNTFLHIGYNINFTEQNFLLNTIISLGKRWELDPNNKPGFQFKACIGAGFSMFGHEPEIGHDSLFFTQWTINTVASADIQYPIVNNVELFIRGFFTLPVHTLYPPHQNRFESIEPNGNRFFNNFFMLATGIAFRF
jgi:hypothetical protein